MTCKSWKDKRLDEIDLDISNQLDRYARECKAEKYIEEYHAILHSNAKSYEQFKQQQKQKASK